MCPPEDGHLSQYQLTDTAAAWDRTHDYLVASPTQGRRTGATAPQL